MRRWRYTASALRARLASATSRSCRAFLIASERAGPCGNFRAASRASSACASKSETSVCSAFILLRRREQRTFGPLGAGRFHPANRRRNSFHRVAPATLEHTVLESSDAGVYTLQIHALPTRRAGRTFSRQQLRQSACAHGCTPPVTKCKSKTVPASVRLPTGIAISESQFRTSSPTYLGAPFHRGSIPIARWPSICVASPSKRRATRPAAPPISPRRRELTQTPPE